MEPAFLEALLAKDPSEVAITLASSPGLAELLSQTSLRRDRLQLLCQVLRKACISRMDRKSLQQVLGLVRDSNFLRICLPQYAAAMLTEAVPAVRHQYPEQVGHIVALVQELVSVFPASSIHQVSMVMSLLPGSVNALRATGVDFSEETEKSLEKLQGFIQHLQEKRRQGTLRLDSHTLVQPSPGEDYRTMPIFPTYQEVHCDEGRPPLRANLTHQPYESPALYLDTHFRLLREDFVRPLREAIVQILRCSADGGLRRQKFDDIWVYFDTRIHSSLCSASGIEHQVQFDSRPLRSVRWENSKRLLYGSLVCLSRDRFKTLLFATVAQRDIRDLQEGIVHLAFSDLSRPLLAGILPSDTFLMVETTAYFEAYRPVLLALQEMREEDIPFQKYIVHCEAQVAGPAYLARGSCCLYNLSCLRRQPRAEEEEEEALNGDLRRCGEVDVLDLQQWPSKEALGLDESQMQALQVALTKEVAIIQGPPGTGKTYVGLKVVEALLSNRAASCGESPLLVVCYTNHALDQFLEGIYAFLRKGIVRVGGRSNSERLKPFTLREIRNRGDARNQLPRHLRQAYSCVSQLMKEAQVDLDCLGAELKCSLRGILRECHLRRHMTQAHWESLTRGQQAKAWGGPERSFLLEWLGLGPSSPFSRGATEDQEDLDQLTEPPEGGREEEELLAVAEEADLAQAERLLDLDEVGMRDPHWRRRRRQEEEVLLDIRFLAMTLEEERKKHPEKEEAEWELQRHQKKAMKHLLKVELSKRERMAEEEGEAVRDVWRLDRGSRWKLYRLWVQKYQAEIRRKMLPHEEAYQEAADRLSELRLQEDLLILQEAQVVGMTTTGAARYRQVLQQLRPQVVVVEEAAEVLEAHTLATLSSDCQHLILIGDHQQLRPSANVFDLARNFNLEVSLFERLVKIGFPFVRLNFQHRMRPEIARLLTPSIYQGLENHPSVLHYESIKGISSNLFFVDHTYPEQEMAEGRSHQNLHEAQFVVDLCRYLMCQGYLPSQITILTTYTGQLYCLRKLMPATRFQGVKVHVVDKYQGEENDIVLLSLVRSNAEGRVGFLKIPNRVCVALSRARKGLYCIGNAAMLGQVPLWNWILQTLREKDQVGPSLLLACQNHPDTKTQVAQPADFRKVSEGGCSRPCETRLDCGHVCPRACHPYDPEHKEVRCLKPCQKVLCPEGHRCSKTCFQPCGDCWVKVSKTLPSCGHTQQVACFLPAEKFCCQEPCRKALNCGHSCKKTCGQACTKRCPEEVQATLLCGHSQEVQCAVAADIQDRKPVPCQAKCLSSLECGHPCPGSCHACFNGRFHVPCRSPCTRILVCSHQCQQPCTGDCPPCQLPCENSCIHSRCPKTCGEACPPCMEPCPWRCLHYQCGRLCSEPCDRPRCDQPCPETLPCGHSCAGMCGEPCPTKCLVCHQEELTQIFFGFEDEPGARFVQLEDCGHLFESQGLDCYMEGGTGGGGEEEEESGSQGMETAIRLKVCPRCQTPIRKNLRYGTLVKRSLSEVEAVKERIRGQPAEMASQVQRLVAEVKGEACLRELCSPQYTLLLQMLQWKQPPLSIGYLGLAEHLIGFYRRLAQLKVGLKKVPPARRAGARVLLDEVAGWLDKPRLSFASQELSDLQRELRRLTYLAELLGLSRVATGKREASVAEQIDTVRQLLEGPGRFSLEEEAEVEAKMEALKALLPASGLGISEEERKQIVAAVTNNTRGHWFKCPNGHIYAIGECGGAMQRGRCPECQEAIGGENHRLEASNRLAPEMDGATHAAWSEEANALNVALLQGLP